MRGLVKLAFVVAVVLSAGIRARGVDAAKPPLCTSGRYAVAEAQVRDAGIALIVLENKTIAIESSCAANRAKLKRTKAGTRVTVKFKKNACPGAAGKVRLKALITDDCKTFTGTIKVKKDSLSFTAADSKCGDGVVDTGRNEACEQQSQCAADEVCAADCTCAPAPKVAKRASKSGTIAISDDEKLVAMVNPDDDSISVFLTANDSRLSKVTTGDEPSAIVIAPDSTTAYVANRADASVVKVTGLDTATPTVSSPLAVGSEPAGLALSPTGAKLFVAELAEGRVSVVDTTTFTVSSTIESPASPRALAVTNDGDADDGDELLVVPEFFGEPVDGGEATDTGRTGRVRLYRLSDLAPQTAITFDPVDSGFTVMTSPNQLWSVSLRAGRIYVTSVSASPALPLQFDRNVFAVIYVGDLATKAKVDAPGGTTSLTKEIVDQVTTRPRFVMGDLVDMDFIPGSNVSYAVSRGADAVQRITWNDGVGVDLGSAANDQINVLGNQTTGLCQAPTGIALKSDATRAYLNCWVTRRLGVIDLTAQALSTTVEASPAPTSPLDLSIQRGKRFYNTGRGRWSNGGGAGPGGVGVGGNLAAGGEGWSSCGSCHPDGLTDDMTWVFGAGPRQTVSQDGSFSHGAGAQKQRIFNYSAIFDEHHDFEANTRNVSGGLGAITTAASVNDCNNLTLETQVALQANLGPSMKEVADDPVQAICQHKDWDDIDEFVKTIRPPRGLRSTAADSIARGRTLFETQGQCNKCHAGAGWTLSRRFFTPSAANNGALATLDFTEPVAWPSTWAYLDNGVARKQISNQPANIPLDATGPAEATGIAPLQVACVVRNVGTFGIPGDTTATDALEKKNNGARAQGRGGYNIPSLYGLALGAPYLHHGQAQSLDDLFTKSAYENHTNAGNANFSVTLGADPQNLTDLKSFLLSIDADTTEIAPPAGFDGCLATFP
jgi:YVTN family beta-propeller protein